MALAWKYQPLICHGVEYKRRFFTWKTVCRYKNTCARARVRVRVRVGVLARVRVGVVVLVRVIARGLVFVRARVRSCSSPYSCSCAFLFLSLYVLVSVFVYASVRALCLASARPPSLHRWAGRPSLAARVPRARSLPTHPFIQPRRLFLVLLVIPRGKEASFPPRERRR